ncbi:bacterial Ig-like domain family protein [Rhodococcus sp. MTM3W5.2]|uniref:Ig-like domain-containing protein n=1 Tax=Rhodococcus sp. MTM3W5.2 TaxID=1805827 RepID=UPI000979232C|nr:Ig-like domain-containing protein [Rhodococcus sp. MTM3W5.2]AQA24332.1 bacterial Ig-like domain family protein [Rhodococcus sp. MTM3W5.2]
MAERATTRGVAAGAATTLTIGALALLGAGVAGAAPGSISWDDGSSHFTRTISNTTPAVGDTITVTTKFERTSWTDEYIYNVKDRHHSCLTYVPGSAKMIGQSEYPVDNPEVNANEAYVRAAWGSTDWVVQNRPGFYRAPTFSVAYKVGQNCPRGTALTTGMDYGGSLGSGNYGNKGPSITIGKSATTTTLAAVTGAQVGKASNLTANVTGGAAGDTIEFRDGATSIGTATLDGAGTATLPWTPTTAGAHTLTVNYPGTAFATASQSAPITAQVAEASVPSTIALAPITDGQVGKASTITATINPAAAGGTVELKDGAASLATLPVGADGKATYQWTPNAAGAHTLNAVFSGHDNVLGSTTTAQVNVAEAPVPSTIALAPITDGQVGKASTITATINPAAAGGTVELKDGAASLATLPVGADGKATYQWTPNAAGAHTLNAVFSGHDNVLGSTTTAQVNVAEAPVPSTIALAPVTDAQVGRASTITATVNPAAAGGTVELKDGAASLATLPVSADGKVTYQWTPAAAGAHTLTATFSGRDNVTGSTTTTQVNVTEAPVNTTDSTTTLNQVGAAAVGTATTVTAKVTPANAGGTVTFKDSGTVIGTGQVGPDGTATAVWTPTTAGQRTITADYSGHGTVNASSGQLPVTVAASGGNGGTGGTGSLSGFGS